MALALEAAARVEGHTAVSACFAGCRKETTLTAFAETEIFHGDDFGDGEAIVQFGEIDLAGGEAGHAVGALGGGTERGERGDVFFLIERQIVARLGDAENVNRGVGPLFSAFEGDEHNGGCAIADEGAIVEVEGVGDGLAVHGLFESDDFAHLCVRVERAIFVIFYGDGGQVFARGAVLVHVAAGDHAEERREGGAGADFGCAIAGGGQDFGDARGGLAGHFFDARDHDDVAEAACDFAPGEEERRTAGGAGIFNARGGDEAHAEGGGDVRCQVILAGEGGTGEVAEIKGFDLAGPDAGIAEAFFARFDGE